MWVYNSLFYSCYRFVSNGRNKYDSVNVRAHSAITLLCALIAMNLIVFLYVVADGTLIASAFVFTCIINHLYFLYGNRYVEIISYFEIQEKRRKVGSVLMILWICFTVISAAFFFQGL